MTVSSPSPLWMIPLPPPNYEKTHIKFKISEKNLSTMDLCNADIEVGVCVYLYNQSLMAGLIVEILFMLFSFYNTA